uniref:Acyl carrier protein n=1 Tax=Gracilaria gracilis TaxID=2777 RepID=A0A345U7W1_GRAGA|nr:acyl carrier protein [Gracilaria gracilis]AXI96547.1 acyl carrier protein [Gracilaria gracilis]
MSSTKSTSSVLERVKNIVVEQLNTTREEIKEDSTFTSLGADSLDTVELVMALEEEFSLEIDDEEAEKIENIGEAVELIKYRMNISD